MFRTAKTLLPVIFACFLFTSCEKEVSSETGSTPGGGGSTGGTAVFSFDGGTGSCTTPSVAGTFKQGTALTAAEKITLIVNVTTAGTYTVTTGMNNGIQFAGSGTFTTTGPTFLELTATGSTPASGGTFNYVPGTNGCSFSVTYAATTGGGAPGDCKDCIYIPMCEGTTFTFVDTTLGGGATESTTTIHILKDTTIDGKIFRKFQNTGADGYYNCTAGVSTLIAYSVPTSGAAVTKVEQTQLKANEAVGATWQNTFTQSIGPVSQTAVYNWKIVAKGISRVVLGKTFTDVIKVHLTLSTTVSGMGTIIGSESDYYYAKGIGLIESETYSVNPVDGSLILTLHRVVKAYTIP